MTVKITKDGNSITTQTAYNPKFAERARKLAGKWDSQRKVWVFPSSQEDRVRALCREIYGTDGGTDGSIVNEQSCTLRVDLSDASTSGTELYVCGRQVARVFGRDSGAKLGDGIVVLEGNFRSGGSMKHPRLMWSDRTVIEVLDCPVGIARKYVANNPESASIVGEEPGGDNVVPINQGRA